MNIVDKLLEEISELQSTISNIQDKCSHPLSGLTSKGYSDTGNWDRGDDCYWTTYKCSLCRKNWDEDGSKKLPRCHR